MCTVYSSHPLTPPTQLTSPELSPARQNRIVAIFDIPTEPELAWPLYLKSSHQELLRRFYSLNTITDQIPK